MIFLSHVGEFVDILSQESIIFGLLDPVEAISLAPDVLAQWHCLRGIRRGIS